MLKSFLKLFEESHNKAKPAYTIELATAALLSELVNADNQVTQTEKDEYKKQLKRLVNVDDEAIAGDSDNEKTTGNQRRAVACKRHFE